MVAASSVRAAGYRGAVARLLVRKFCSRRLVAAIAAAFGAPVILQVVIAAGVAIVTLFSLRPLALKFLHRGEPAVTNVDALVGIGALGCRKG